MGGHKHSLSKSVFKDLLDPASRYAANENAAYINANHPERPMMYEAMKRYNGDHSTKREREFYDSLWEIAQS
jgi:hypothetical protein